MRKKMIAGLTSIGLVAGAGATAVVAASPGLALAQEEEATAPQNPGLHRGGVFAGLVEDGVLDDAEVAAVQETLLALREAAREEAGAEPRLERRHPARAGFRLHELLDDDVIDADEIAGLPADSPILDPDGPFAPYLEDGELTADEMEELKAARQVEMEERRAEREAAVIEALQALVDDGTLTTDQVDAIVEALQTARDERPHRMRRGMRAGWQIAELLEDGVIDADELAELPEGHPLTDPEGPAADFLDDGQLTEDELAELRSQRHPVPAESGAEV
jgi:hypothetical protein